MGRAIPLRGISFLRLTRKVKKRWLRYGAKASPILIIVARRSMCELI